MAFPKLSEPANPIEIFSKRPKHRVIVQTLIQSVRFLFFMDLKVGKALNEHVNANIILPIFFANPAGVPEKEESLFVGAIGAPIRINSRTINNEATENVEINDKFPKYF